jgi:hypothetical protein
MSADAYEKTNLGWQVQLLQQQIGEWLELKLSQAQHSLPNFSLPSWLRNLSLPSWLPKAIFWVIVALFLTWVGWQIWRLWGKHLRGLSSQLRNLAEKPASGRVRELTMSEWLRRASQFQRQGNYREACRCLYMAMLQQLNDTGIAPALASRTDGEYLQLTQDLFQHQSYQTLVTTHEQLCFGNAEISQPIFEQCQQAYREISRAARESQGRDA